MKVKVYLIEKELAEKEKNMQKNNKKQSFEISVFDTKLMFADFKNKNKYLKLLPNKKIDVCGYLFENIIPEFKDIKDGYDLEFDIVKEKLYISEKAKSAILVNSVFEVEMSRY